MSSINQQQPEHHRENLVGAAAVEKLAELAKEAKTCFFCTAPAGSDTGGVRPMTVLEADQQGNLWFLSASDSHQNREIEANPSVKLFFQGSPRAEFMVLDGFATISRDRARIAQLWNFMHKTWFTEGQDDPRITVIKVAPTQGYYWDNKHGAAVAGMKMMIGAVIGETLDDSVKGTLRV